VKVIVTNGRIEIYREELDGIDGCGCREFAQYMMAWAIERLSDNLQRSIKEPGGDDSVLCD
jgi:hypothetical protein